MYTGYLLTEETRSALMAMFPPKYERVVAHHITETFGVPSDTPPPALPLAVTVVGYVDSGDGVEGLLVTVNGNTYRPDGSRYHVTWSLGEGRRPVETNNYMVDAHSVRHMNIEVIPRTFTR